MARFGTFLVYVYISKKITWAMQLFNVHVIHFNMLQGEGGKRQSIARPWYHWNHYRNHIIIIILTCYKFVSLLMYNLTGEMAQSVEKATQLQSNAKLWYTYCAGWVTASRMKSVCHTGLANPSQSLIKVILKLLALWISRWTGGANMTARDMYYWINSGLHDNFGL